MVEPTRTNKFCPSTYRQHIDQLQQLFLQPIVFLTHFGFLFQPHYSLLVTDPREYFYQKIVHFQNLTPFKESIYRFIFV